MLRLSRFRQSRKFDILLGSRHGLDHRLTFLVSFHCVDDVFGHAHVCGIVLPLGFVVIGHALWRGVTDFIIIVVVVVVAAVIFIIIVIKVALIDFLS